MRQSRNLAKWPVTTEPGFDLAIRGTCNTRLSRLVPVPSSCHGPRLDHDPEVSQWIQAIVLADVRWLRLCEIPKRDRTFLWAAGLLGVADFLSAIDVECDFGTLTATDPGALHRLCPMRLVKRINTVKQLIRIFGDPEEPLLQFLADNLILTAFAFAVPHLLVGKHGLTARAPIHRSTLFIGEARLTKLEKQPLGPFAVVGF